MFLVALPFAVDFAGAAVLFAVYFAEMAVPFAETTIPLEPAADPAAFFTNSIILLLEMAKCKPCR